MDVAERERILGTYRDYRRRFEAAAGRAGRGNAPVILLPVVSQLEPTTCEIEVLQFVADGLTNGEIGERLFLAEETVKSRMRQVLRKLDARSRAHAVAIGFQRGLLT
jgi:DNA-binding NarL/FixJ family response regulator